MELGVLDRVSPLAASDGTRGWQSDRVRMRGHSMREPDRDWDGPPGTLCHGLCVRSCVTAALHCCWTEAYPGWHSDGRDCACGAGVAGAHAVAGPGRMETWPAPPLARIVVLTVSHAWLSQGSGKDARADQASLSGAAPRPATCSPYNLACLPGQGGPPATARRVLDNLRGAFSDLMEDPSRSAPPAPRSGSPGRADADGRRLQSSTGRSGSTGSLSAFVSAAASRISAAAKRPALAGGGPGPATVGAALMNAGQSRGQPVAQSMQRHGSVFSDADRVKGAKSD